MRKINKSAPPPSFLTYSRTPGASFDSIKGEVKEELKDALLDEQGWVCGYCQQKISSKSRMKIEHFCEQSICNGENEGEDMRLDYTNFLAVCMGDAGLGRLHCDTKKATYNINNGLPIEICPWNDAHMAGVNYSSTGRISSINPRHNKEIDEILNLNIELLKEQRRKGFIQVYKESVNPNETRRREKMKRILEAQIDRAGGRFASDFPGMYEYMLRKYC